MQWKSPNFLFKNACTPSLQQPEFLSRVSCVPHASPSRRICRGGPSSQLGNSWWLLDGEFVDEFNSNCARHAGRSLDRELAVVKHTGADANAHDNEEIDHCLLACESEWYAWVL